MAPIVLALRAMDLNGVDPPRGNGRSFGPPGHGTRKVGGFDGEGKGSSHVPRALALWGYLRAVPKGIISEVLEPRAGGPDILLTPNVPFGVTHRHPPRPRSGSDVQPRRGWMLWGGTQLPERHVRG